MAATALSIQRPRGRIPNSIHGRMQPKLQQDVVRLESGVGLEISPPVTLRRLALQERVKIALLDQHRRRTKFSESEIWRLDFIVDAAGCALDFGPYEGEE
jgi:hypothetical protein